MPLITAALTTDLAADFKTIELPLKAALDISLRDPKLGTNSLYEAFSDVDKWVKANPQESPVNVDDYQKRVWRETAKEWAETFSDKIATDITDTLMTVLAPQLAATIDKHLKTSSIYITLPAGTVTVGAGTTAVMNPVPIELTFDPLDNIKNGGLK
jgi:hypothetical protein